MIPVRPPTDEWNSIEVHVDVREGPWWRLFEEVEGAAIVHVDLTPNTAHEEEAFALLDADERARWKRFLYPAPARRYALCRGALRALLCRQLACSNHALVFGAAERGKPYALVRGARASIGFSVSHSGKHGLIALASGGMLGVDVEDRTALRNLDLVIEAVLTPDEQAEMAQVDGPAKTRAFFRSWTVKEALAKALGTGLALDVSTFEVPTAIRRGMRTDTFRFPDSPAITWRVENLGNEDFAAAVAYEIAPHPGIAGNAAPDLPTPAV